MGSGASKAPKPQVVKVMPEPTTTKQRKKRNQEFREIEITNPSAEASSFEKGHPSTRGQGAPSNGLSQGSSHVIEEPLGNEQMKSQLQKHLENPNFDELNHKLEGSGQVAGNGSVQQEAERGRWYDENQRWHPKNQLQGGNSHDHSRPEISQYKAEVTGYNNIQPFGNYGGYAADEFYGGARTVRYGQNATGRHRQAAHLIQQQQRVANALRPQSHDVPHKNKDTFSLAKQIQKMEDEDVIVFETFYHHNGRSYTCINQGGQRFYMDSFDTQEWQPFPNLWYSQGHFERDGEAIKDAEQADPLARQELQFGMTPSTSYNQQSLPTSLRDINVSPGLGGSQMDDRAGTIQHPTRGRILTYIFEEKRNIHCYFDDATGGWIKMPISWEQHTDFIKPLVQQIKETLPTWEDKYDIVAALRQSNYDLDDTVSTYYAVGDTGVMDTPDRLAGLNSNVIKEKDDRISILQTKLAKLSREHEMMKMENHELETDNNIMKVQFTMLQEQVTTLEVDVKTANLKVTSLQQERPNTARPITRMNTKIQAPEPQVPVIDEETLKKVDKQIKALDKAHRGLKNHVKECFADINDLLGQARKAVSQMTNIGSSTNQELEDLKVLYKKECLQRKLLYNQIQELRGNIRVFCRVRFDDRTENCHEFPSDQDIMCNNAAGKKASFMFDKVFTPESTQTEVFAEVLPTITSCVDGYNVCIMAYGQTGSGKTFTMMGPPADPGVNIRSIRELLKVCSERTKISYTLKVSMVEVYNEHVRDLLSEQNKEALDIRMQGKRLVIKGLTEFQVNDESDITKVMEIGDRNRSVASTKMNSSSSRSHLLLILTVEGVNKVSNATSFGSLTLVDLAGSERIAKTEATGQRLVEAAAINKSLTSLGQVFTGLRLNTLHIPYRNSKLTHLLQPSLGGDAKACLFVNVSPDKKNKSESMSTLQFGANAKQVQLGKATQNIKGH
ncbi:kinesin-like protein klp-3 [Anneissia japonica]|uniref:kinesin-like protein klp-3 n=1 Tax=Anneissia japonica TaxID=1529436 RepID=UPI0014255671|nr:kinesin-like protein klp-3 [Anneissia japonica]